MMKMNQASTSVVPVFSIGGVVADMPAIEAYAAFFDAVIIVDFPTHNVRDGVYSDSLTPTSEYPQHSLSVGGSQSPNVARAFWGASMLSFCLSPVRNA